MRRKEILILAVIITLFSLASCVMQTPTTTKDEHFLAFEKRFSALPDGSTATPWQIERSGDDMIYTTVLFCGEQYSYTLELITNKDDRVVSLCLQNECVDAGNSCFAELSYHVYCAMGFNDIDAKGNRPFTDADAFCSYFKLCPYQLAESSAWINRYEVKHTYISGLKTESFTIIYPST